MVVLRRHWPGKSATLWEQIYYRSSDALWVNLYIASTVRCEEVGVELRQETRFPDEEAVRFLFTCKTPQTCALKFRHPYWCEKPEVKLNGEGISVETSPSSYMTIEGTWKTGDVLEFRLPMTLRLEPLPHSDEKIFAVMFGPTVLAGIVPEEPGVPKPAKQRFSEHLNARGKTDAFPPLFVAENTAAAHNARLRRASRTLRVNHRIQRTLTPARAPPAPAPRCQSA
jgi:DUF1680 family protein